MPTTIDGSGNVNSVLVVLATQAQAEAGSNNASLMTPLRVEQYALAHDLGRGQTWQDMAGSRAVSTSYQNSTGRPIQLSIQVVATTSERAMQVSSNGSTWVTVGVFTTAAEPSAPTLVNVVIPDGWYYRVNGAGTIRYWAELR